MTNLDDDQISTRLHAALEPLTRPLGPGLNLTAATRQRAAGATPSVAAVRFQRPPFGTRRARPRIFVASALIIAAGGLLAVHQELVSAPQVSTAGGSVLYTAAMVEQMATATRAAVARSGMAHVNFTDTLADSRGVSLQTASGSSMFSFSGSALSLDTKFTVVPGNQVGTTAYDSDTIRVVAGYEYALYQGNWYQLPSNDLGPSATTGLLQPDTDPRIFLQTLSPAARFQIVGRETVDGVELTHLTAANRNLAIPFQFHTSLSVGEPNGKEVVMPLVENSVMTVPALNVWVDNSGIVHRMDLTASISTASVTTVPASRPLDSNEATIQVLSLTFSNLGQPEVITAPAHPNPTLPSCGYACIDNFYGTVPPRPQPLP